MKFFDGSFGTYYISKTGDYGLCELANLNSPDVVLGIHREYIACGVNAVTTNTFRANPGEFGDAGLLTRVITEGYRLAREAAGADIDVFADIGGISDEETAEEQYLRVVDIFLGLGARNFIFETLPGFAGIAAAAAEIKRRTDNSTVVVSFAVSQAGYAANGDYYKALIDQAVSCGDIDAAGLNCVCGPAHLLSLARGIAGQKKSLIIMPNAGYPSHINGRLVFQDNAEYFAEKMREINALGIDMLGGCCGTTPEHIRKMIAAVTGGGRQQPENTKRYAGGSLPRLRLKPCMVELDPPMDGGDGFILSSAKRLKDCGVEAITLADSPLSRARADSVLTAARIKSEVHIDVMPHMTCRDKNAIALRGSLLGAHFFGIDKVLVITGDPLIDGGKSSAVFNFNSTQLISYINNMNRDIFHEHPFRIGAALNVNAVNFDLELARARKKLMNGAEFILTQPMFSKESVGNFKKARQELDCKLYAGIMPVAGYKNAVFLNNEVPGVKIPPEVVASLKDSADPTDASISFSAGIINSVYDHADGFYIMTPLKKVELVCELVNRCFYAN